MKVIPLLIGALIFSLLSCREVRQAIKPPKETNLLSYLKTPSPYVKDESLDLFLTNPWYTYDESNHIIWPIFQVYSLKADDRYFKVQVIDYYDEQSQPGHYTLRVQEEGKSAFLWDFYAQGCGNVYTNLSYKECIKDPETNIYTYLDFDSQTSWQMSDEEARANKVWDIAFNGTEVKINAGIQGPGDSRIADLYLYEGFFSNTAADFQEIAEVSFSDKGKRFFELNIDLRNVAFSLPPGVDRVVNEPYWFKERDGLHVANPANWWILKGGEKNSYSKFHVKEILENKNEDLVESTIVFEYFYQGIGTDVFEPTLKEWKLPPFDSSQRLLKWCLDFDSESLIDCSEEHWDLRLSVSNRRGRRRWRINVNEGAIGPLKSDEARIFQSAP